MSAEQSSQSSCEDIISNLAWVARAAVYYDKSYDVVDELNRMADNPDYVLQLLSELSRVVLKVFNDVREYVNSQRSKDKEGSKDEKDKKVEKLYRAMQSWSKYLEDFERVCLTPQNVRKLASLSLVPDDYALTLSEVLGK